jgi:hypothetical protein
MKMHFTRTALFALFLGSLVCARSQAIVLYDGSQNNFPEDQPWLTYFPNVAVPTKTAAGGKTTLDTGAMATQVGWWNRNPLAGFTQKNAAFPTLDRSAGFSLGFDLKTISESHDAGNDRAGFSVILLASDHLGIEVGFWQNTIFGQEISAGPVIAPLESHSFDTTAQTHYDLKIQGSSYELDANGLSILTGPLRDYSPYLSIPYSLGKYVFLGDDTTSATGKFELASVTLVPEPGLALLLPAVIGLAVRRRSFRWL